MAFKRMSCVQIYCGCCGKIFVDTDFDDAKEMMTWKRDPLSAYHTHEKCIEHIKRTNEIEMAETNTGLTKKSIVRSFPCSIAIGVLLIILTTVCFLADLVS